MAGLAPGDPQLVSMIVNHLKTQGLFDQFRRDCLADVDTKPAYLNLRQRVDNFVSNHLSNHTWSPHLNKNQLRNNIRQLVLQSGMLEQGVDRIVAQVVDPKIHHTFRPQVERVVREFLSPGLASDEPPACIVQPDEKQDHHLQNPGPSSFPTPSMASDAMSILDTITSLNQEANAWTSGERPIDKSGRQCDFSPGEEQLQEPEPGELDTNLMDGEDSKVQEGEKAELEAQGVEPEMDSAPAGMEADGSPGEVEQQMKQEDGEEPKEQTEEVEEAKAEEGKDKVGEKVTKKVREEAPAKDGEAQSEKHHIRQKARERLKEEYSLEDSDLEGLSDITVSSVHTSDLSSFEGESEEEPQVSDSTEEGEITSEDDDKVQSKKTVMQKENKDCKPRGGRQAYVHKPFLYSRYYSDSDDEVTVEQRRRSAAKDKEERLLKRQQNRERMEEKRRQKIAQQEEHEERMETSPSSLEVPDTSGKEARKEKKVLEKKVAMNWERKKHSRKDDDVGNKKKGEAEEDLMRKSDDMKTSLLKGHQNRSIRRISETAMSEEGQRRKSSGESPAGEPRDPKKLVDKSKTHSFILDLEQGSEELFRQRAAGKFDRHPRRDQVKERSLSDERNKQKLKSERIRGGGRSSSDAYMEENLQKDGCLPVKALGDEKGEKKAKSQGDRRTSSSGRESRLSIQEGGTLEKSAQKDTIKKVKVTSGDGVKLEKCKAEKVPSVKSEAKLPFGLDSMGSSEEKSDIELGSESGKKKDKSSKEMAKRSKSHTEDKNVEKAKPKLETKDIRPCEKDADRKLKLDQVVLDYAKSERPSSDTDPEHKSKETEMGSKVKSTHTEKSRSKSKEDSKAQPLSKDKKSLSQESKCKGAKTSNRSDSSKERKREGGSKEESKTSDEILQEKTKDVGGSKKVAEEAGEFVGVGEACAGSSFSSPFPETLQLASDKLHTQECLMHSESTGATTTTTVMDDTFDALSDITPEPEEDEPAMQISDDMAFHPDSSEVVSPPRPKEDLSTDNILSDATSKVLRLHPQEGAYNIPPETPNVGLVSCVPTAAESPEMSGPLPGISLQEADLKMQEAALTLLSMDPDMSACHSFITAHQPVAMGTAVPEQHGPFTLETAAESHMFNSSDRTATEGEMSQELDQSKPNSTGVMDSSAGDPMVSGSVTEDTSEKCEVDGAAVAEEIENQDMDDSVLLTKTEDRSQAAMKDDLHSDQGLESVVDAVVSQNRSDAQDGELEVERPGEEACDWTNKASISSPGNSDVLTKTGDGKMNVQEVEISDGKNMQGTEEEQPQSPKPGETYEHKGETQTEDSGQGEQLSKKPTKETGGDVTTSDQKQEGAGVEDQPEQLGEVKEPSRGGPARLVRQSSSASKSDGQEEEKERALSEAEDRQEGRVTRTVKQTGQKPTAAKDAGNDNKDKERSTETREGQEGEMDEVKETRSGQMRPGQSGHPAAQMESGKPQKETSKENVSSVQRLESDDINEQYKESQLLHQGQSFRTEASPLRKSSSSSKECEKEEGVDSQEEEPEKIATAVQRGRRSVSAKYNQQRKSEEESVEETEDRQEDEEGKIGLKRAGRRGRMGRPPSTGGEPSDKVLKDQAKEKEELENSDSKETLDSRQPAVKRKRTEEGVESEEDSQAEEVELASNGAEGQPPGLPKDNSGESQSDGQEGRGDASSADKRADSEEVKEPPPEKKPARRGRPPKMAATSSTEEPDKGVLEKRDRKTAETTGEQQQEEECDDEGEEEETQMRATTRSAARLEAERNKPSKPSTRALSKLSGKDDTNAGSRVGRGQGRKRDISPPMVRTRGGQKLEEPPTKRTKR